MAVTIRETEAKYDAPGGAVLPQLDVLPQVSGVLPPDDQHLDAVYYDTDDLRLLKAGITLRRRMGGTDEGWHLKLPVGPNTREEVRLPLGSGTHVPAELADLVLARTRGRGLTAVATITTQRRVSTLVDKRGRSLAEVADDAVSARHLRDGSPAELWREVEVELTGGDNTLLAAADVLLRHSGLHRSGRSAKLERVLLSNSAKPARPERLTPSSTAGQAILAYLSTQAETLKSMDALVRRTAPDSVHQMRVTTRRLRAVLRSFDQVINQAGGRRVADELGWLGAILGAARDAEVQAERMRQHIDRAAVEVIIGPVGARVQAHFAKVSHAANTAVSAALTSERYYRLLDDLDSLLADPPLGPDASRRAAEILAAAVRRSYRKTRKRMRRSQREPAGPARDTGLHQARKAAKQARYAAEVAAPVIGADAGQFARRVKKVQAVLGEHQDTVVGRQLARQLGIAAHLAGENAFSYGMFYGDDEYDALRLQAQARKAWKQAARARYVSWMEP